MYRRAWSTLHFWSTYRYMYIGIIASRCWCCWPDQCNDSSIFVFVHGFLHSRTACISFAVLLVIFNVGSGMLWHGVMGMMFCSFVHLWWSWKYRYIVVSWASALHGVGWSAGRLVGDRWLTWSVHVGTSSGTICYISLVLEAGGWIYLINLWYLVCFLPLYWILFI